MVVVIKFFCWVLFKVKNDMNLSNKRVEFLLIKLIKWNNVWYIEFINNDI